MWEGYKNYDHYWSYQAGQFPQFVKEAIGASRPQEEITPKGVSYLTLPASFDIETSSFKKGEKKFATMYIWQFGLNGSVIYGRTWDEFMEMISQLAHFLELNPYNRILVVYVHNLGYEFQFIRKRLKWVKDNAGKDRVFSVKERRPVYALSEWGIEFRCSYLLSNYSLAYVGDQLLKSYPVQKMKGDLDYSKVRHSLTPLTEKELGYCINDVRVVMSYIQEKIESDGGILKIPLTNTGYVRNYCRNYCMDDGETTIRNKKKRAYAYRDIMKSLSIVSEREYTDLKAAFAGGFTHASVLHVNKVLHNVGSADLTSSYPFTMVCQKFPMSKGVFIGKVENPDMLEMYCRDYCCLFTVRFTGLYSVLTYESYISTSHCDILSDDYVSNNGRLVSAEQAQLTITELDWDIISKVYDWDDCEIFAMRIYEKAYLPRPLIMSILELYKNKTSLKGVDDKEIEYMVSKNMINSAYGMAVTNIVRDENVYKDGEWLKEEADTASQLVSYNKNFHRFLFYAWGVWVTAHARHNLWDAILEFAEDYVYSDTDSIKAINFDKHKDFFSHYNLNVRFALAEMCNYYKIPFEMVMPKTIKGVSKLIGVWDIEESYKSFKTLGAKRYMYEHESGELNMTVSGVNKKFAVPYLLYEYTGKRYHTKAWLKKFQLAYTPDTRLREESKQAMKEILELHNTSRLGYEYIFKMFDNSLFIPAGYTGKQTLTYLDKRQKFICTDYTGMQWLCDEFSSTHMEPASYYFSMSKQYLDYIAGFRDASI